MAEKTLTEEMEELQRLGVLHVVGGVPQGLPPRGELTRGLQAAYEFADRLSEGIGQEALDKLLNEEDYK